MVARSHRALRLVGRAERRHACVGRQSAIERPGPSTALVTLWPLASLRVDGFLKHLKRMQARRPYQLRRREVGWGPRRPQPALRRVQRLLILRVEARA
jgi:hypothetical protein